MATGSGSDSHLEELSADDIIEDGTQDGAPARIDVRAERVSLLSAAQNARSVAMLTGTHGVVAAPLSRAALRVPPASALAPEGTTQGEPDRTDLVSLLSARASAAEAKGDTVARHRAQLELAYATLDAGDAAAAAKHAEDAVATLHHAPAAHALLRTLVATREQRGRELAHVEELVAHGGDRTRADFLAEKGRLLEVPAGPTAESVAAFAEALAAAPEHAAALYGLEAALDATERWADLATQLGKLADLAGTTDASAWLHAERAILLDRRLEDSAGARAAFDQALALAPGIGPVRDAATDHAFLHRDDARVAMLLEGEAALERETARAARLELDAALALLAAGSEHAKALKLLERAHSRAPTTKLADARVAEELARLLEREGRHAELLRVRKAALRLADDPREELVALRAVASAAERAGELDVAVLALERARVVDGDDATLLAELDRLLVVAGRHEARAVTWMRESARVDDAETRARALLRAAEASRAAGREGDAVKYMQAAWIAAPGAPAAFDALAERLAVAGSREAVPARVALYEQAARATPDARRRLYYLEKIAWLWDDVAGDPASAARAYEEVLSMDGARASAIAGLASAAMRAGDARRLAKALLAEADATDGDARAVARLRAAEALAPMDPERALELAEELRAGAPVAQARAAELVTRIHADAGRWELVARTFAERRKAAETTAAKIALALAEVDVLTDRLGSHERALSTLAEARVDAPGDPALASATIGALEAIGDPKRLRAELERLAEGATSPLARAGRLLRAAELAAAAPDGDPEAVRLYEAARTALPAEPLVVDRLRRMGARAEVPEDTAQPFVHAVRALDRGKKAGAAEPLLASETRAFHTLRIAERLARRAKSAPQLANALAMEVDLGDPQGLLARRALSGLASLVSWTLPETDDVEPWDRLLAAGSHDAVELDTLVARARRGVYAGDAHAIDLATKASLRRAEGASDDTERLVFALERARLAKRRGALAEAAKACRDALAVDAWSITAAVTLGELAAELGDRRGAIAAATAIADVTLDPRARAQLLGDAADLSAAEGDAAAAATLLERALDSDPDAVGVAARLALLQVERKEFAELARVLRSGLAGARTAEAIVPMASELADVARHRLKDPLLAIEALERARSVSPDHVPALFNLAELYIGQRAWQKSLGALGDVVVCSSERDEKIVAHLGRASILGRVLDDKAAAERELRAALVLDPHDARAVAALLKIPDVVTPKERAELLGRVVIVETNKNERLTALLELASLRRELGDAAGAEGALVEAAALSPDLAMLERVRVASGGDAETIARVLGRALARAREANVAPETSWLVKLGDLEMSLGRVDAAIELFEDVLRAEPDRKSARLSLARALAARGRHETAATHLLGAFAPTRAGTSENGAGSVDGGFVRLLDETLSGAGRDQQAHVARELRAIAGDLADAERAKLDARRRTYGGHSEGLSVASLRSFVMPAPLGRHAIWDVAGLCQGMAGKLARVALADQGASSRDRLKPKAVHPLRQLFDRLVREFECFDVELAVSEHLAAPVIAVEDVPWIVVPASLADWPDAHAVAALAKPLARVALGVPWLGAIAPNEVLSILVAVARQVAPRFAATPADRVEPLVEDYELRARKAIDRKKRRSLEDLETQLVAAKPIDEASFVDAVHRTEARAAFLLCGDLRASLDAIATGDPALADAIRVPGPKALGGLFARPVARDLVAYALSADATALRKSLGTLWA